MYKYILASKSPRRKELMENIGMKFTVCESSFDESTVTKYSDTSMYVCELALCKAMDLVKNSPKDTLIIGADTVVEFDGEILGKPADRDEAIDMLQRLSGNVHYVYTGVAVVRSNDAKSYSSFEKTAVYFENISREEIEYYVDNYPPYDKAGGYGIQGYAGVFVNRIEGDYFNVVGLPVCLLHRIIKQEFGED